MREDFQPKDENLIAQRVWSLWGTVLIQTASLFWIQLIVNACYLWLVNSCLKYILKGWTVSKKQDWHFVPQIQLPVNSPVLRFRFSLLPTEHLYRSVLQHNMSYPHPFPERQFLRTVGNHSGLEPRALLQLYCMDAKKNAKLSDKFRLPPVSTMDHNPTGTSLV